MQAYVGDSLSGAGIVAGIVAGYTYAARYRYSDTVVQNDNFLRISAGEDARQTSVSFSVMTAPPTRTAAFTEGFGNLTHRVRLTAPYQEFTILAIGWREPRTPPAPPTPPPGGFHWGTIPTGS